MNLTNDMQRLKEAADGIAKERGQEMASPRTISEEMQGTYYSRRTDESSNPQNVLREYDFHTPLEYKKELEQMWTLMGKEEMKAFLPVCMASLAKSKPKEGEKQEGNTVSPYIYEF